MTHQELYQRLDLPDPIPAQLEKAAALLPLDGLESCLSRLLSPASAREAYQELDALLGEDPGHIQMLYCQLECARRAYETYRERQIPDTIFFDTMKCFSRFIRECGRKTGVLAFDRGWWTYHQISMDLFRVGELEYQLRTKDGQPRLALHIPSDADLSADAVDRSLSLAREFLRGFAPAWESAPWTCDSWLLSPVLRELLPEGSRILAFQNRFEILEVQPDGREYLEWLFCALPDAEVASLPERTSLQRKAKALMAKGGNIGSAFGILRV